MLGKTHMAVGIACSLAVLQPAGLTELVLGTGAAAVGAVISDIDVGTSGSHREAERIEMMAVASVLIVAAADVLLHLGIGNRLLQSSGISRTLVAGLCFLLICFWGKDQPHRSFMHSFAALIGLSACIGVFWPAVTPYFFIAFLSHQAIDLLNFKGEKLFWPMKKSFSLDLCSSRGRVNRGLFLAGSAVSVCLFLKLAWAAIA